MAEQTRTREARKAYTYSWYLPAATPKNEAAASPAQLIEVSQDVQVTEDADSSLQLFNPQPMEVTRPIPLVKPRSRMPMQKYKEHGILSNRLRLAAVAGWSSVAAVGMGALVVLRHGPFPTLQIGELAALWAGLSAALWVFTSKFGK